MKIFIFLKIANVELSQRKERRWVFHINCWINELVQVDHIPKHVKYLLILSTLILHCSVLDLDAFERNTKAEGLGVGAEGAAGEKNMHDAEFTCALFRFIQLTCEGHNLGINRN